MPKPASASWCAETIADGIARDRAVIPVTLEAHVAWRLARVSPWIASRLASRIASSVRLPRDEHHDEAAVQGPRIPTLAVYCPTGASPPRSTLLDTGHPRLDTLTIPGGPGLLNHKTSGYSDCDTFSRSAEFLIREHHITTVVLLAHDGCGFYGRKFPDLTPEQVRKRQHDDLRLAERELLETHPRLRVEAFVAVPSGEHVRFDPVER
jgi:hypothetical protein